MARQATLNTGPIRSINGMVDGIGDLGSNVLTLTTLQAQLASQDLREATRRAQPAIAGIAGAMVISLASVGVGLAGLGYVIASRWDLSVGQSLLLVALGGLLVSGLVVVLAARRFSHSFESFRRSREELERNIAWLRTVLTQSG